MNSKYVKATAAALLCALLLGSLPVSSATTPTGNDTKVIMTGNWTVSANTVRTNEVILLTEGNLTINPGVSLTLVNTTVLVNCSYDGEHFIDVKGTLIMQDGGDGLSPNFPGDSDASNISANSSTGFRPYFWVEPGATFTATNSIIEYIGSDAWNGILTGGDLPESDFTQWQAITNGSFRISIDGNAKDVSNLDFSGVTSMADVANVVMTALQAFNFDGYTAAQVVWTGTGFTIAAGTLSNVDGLTTMKSTVALLGTHSTGAGFDISGMHNRSGVNTWWLDCALNATANNCYPWALGPYMESSAVSISNCLVQNNEYGMIFDSVYPAIFQNNNVSNNDQMGLLVSNITNPNFALPSVTLSNNNFVGNGYHSVAIQASTIGIEVFNVNASENGYGVNLYSKGNMNANVHDCEMWRNSGGTHNHATALLMWTGPTGTLTGTVEHNEVIDNSCGGLWAGYQFGGTASYDTTLLIRNNTFVGNDGKETFQAINNLNVRVFDNYFGGSDYHNEADGMRIGFRHGDSYDFAPADTYVKNLYVVVANNVFDYGNFSDQWCVGGAVLTAARVYMDATITGNTVWGGYEIGGLFRVGWPHPFEVCEGDPRFKRVDTLKAYVADNDITILYNDVADQYPRVGGIINFFAEDLTDIVCSDNTIYTTGGQIGTYIGVNFGAGNAGDYTIPCREVKAVIERNHLTFNMTNDNTNGMSIGGFIRVYGSYHIDAKINDNVLHKNINGTMSDEPRFPWIWIGHPDDGADNADARPTYIDMAVARNTLRYDLNITPTTGYSIDVAPLIRAWAILDINANITGNNIQIVHRYNAFDHSLQLGSAIRLHAYGTVNMAIVNNNIHLSNRYMGASTGSWSLGGIIKVGLMEPTPQFVNGKITGNTIEFFDNSTTESTVGSVFRIATQVKADLEITDNDIYIKSYKANADIDVGEVFRVWKCVDTDQDFNVPQEIEMDLHRNNVQIFNNATTSSDGGGGIMRLHGLTSTVLRMTENVFQYTPTNPTFDNDTQYDMGVRVGYHCYQDGILSNNVNVTTRNNVIGPGGVGGAFIVGGSIVNLDMDGDTIQKARYNDCGDMGYYTTEYTYGNGLVLLGDQINANIHNVKMINNEGAGLYLDTTGDANLFLDNCYIYNNSWHGMLTKGQAGMTDMGRVNNTRILWNGNNTNLDLPGLGSGVYAINSKITYSNCTLSNPNVTTEFNVTDTSFVTGLNTLFNSSRVTIAPYSHFLRQWFMNLKVQQLTSGNGIPFADVVVNELGGANAYNSQVGMDGWWRWMPMSQYIQNGSSTTTLTPHAVTATKGTETGNANPVMTTNRDVTIVLDYTSQPPVADAGPDQTVNESTIVTFDGSGSTDDYMIVNYTWTCAVLGFIGYGINPTFNVTTQAGVHNVTLTVRDIEGFQDTDYVLITVVDATPPVANAGPDRIVNEDVLVTLDGTGSTDNLAVANYTWTFNDGAPRTLWGAQPTYTFAQPGTYVITLTVSDAAGLTSTDTMNITVLDVTAPAVTAGAPQTVAEGTLVTLSGVGSTDNVGIVSYTWTFNDGANDITRSGQTVTYTFRNRGNFTVTLSCADAAGNIGTGTTYVVVQDQTAPHVLVVAPGESLTGVPIDWVLTIVFDEPMDTASVEAAFNITGGIEVVSWTWDATHRYATVEFGPMAYATAYTITVSAAATDTSGNHLAATYSATFTTLAAPEIPSAESSFMADNWWILVVIIVVLAVLLMVSLLRGKKEPAQAAAPAPTPAPYQGPEPEAEPAEEEIQ